MQMTLFDVQQRITLAELSTPFIKYVVWNGDMSSVALLSKHAIVIADKKLGNAQTVHETIRCAAFGVGRRGRLLLVCAAAQAGSLAARTQCTIRGAAMEDLRCGLSAVEIWFLCCLINVALLSKHAIVIADKKLGNAQTVHETIRCAAT
jgi:hypothetical protein